MALGLDTHTREPDWKKLKANGLDFAYLKVSEGGDFPASNDWYVRNLHAARDAGVKVGGYHYARPDTAESTWKEEADFFLSRLRLARGDLRPVLDFEVPPQNGDWAVKWLDYVAGKIGQNPIFYSYGPFIAALKFTDKTLAQLKRYPLWFADYGPDDGKRHAVTAPAGFRMIAHQYTSKGRLAGISGDVDLNHAPDLTPLVYDPIYTGPVEFVVDGNVVADGKFLDATGKPTNALSKFITAVRHNEGRGSVRPKG